ncbi:MAG: hypothetical protein KBC96_11505 [Armatimonadetes bacterium]|nr:hypothetical protein [Armatimonadota bacterium]
MRIEIRSGAQVIASAVLDRLEDEDESTVSFEDLPPGNLAAVATAYGQPGAVGTPVASCTEPFALQAGQHKSLSLAVWTDVEPVTTGVAAAGTEPDITSAFDDGGVFIGWNDFVGIRSSDIVEYHVWRDVYGNYIQSDGDSTLACPVLVPDVVTAVPYSGGIGHFDHHSIDDTATRLDYTWYCFGTDGELAQCTQETMPGITVGKTHHYWISAVYRVISSTDGRVVYRETTPVYLGSATYVSPPACRSAVPAAGPPLISVTFNWELSQGADRYRVEVSTSDQFIRAKTVCVDVDRSASQLTVDLSNCSELGGVADGQRLFWRVGAKNSNDSPGPLPSGTGSSVAKTGAKNTRYIYSTEPGQFTVGEDSDDPGGGDPPPPPDI